MPTRKPNERATARCARRGVATLAFAMLVGMPALGQQKPVDLASASIEDLMNVEVTSVSRREQKLSRTASAVFVISTDEIRQSGATNVPDLLRMVPGIQVAQINANSWAISARGFNSRYSSNLLVLVDGRSVYTPTFDGVFWDVLNVPLEDIERIEVIRGPGAAVWGANAVNGVINIITKNASETYGVHIEGSGGNVSQGFGSVRYGGHAWKKTDFRMYASYLNRGDFPGGNGSSGADGWHLLQGGFRADTSVSPKDTLMFAGDLYTGREGLPTFAVPSITSAQEPQDSRVNLAGGFFQVNWSHRHSQRSHTDVQLSYDEYERYDVLREHRGTFDAEFQNEFQWHNRQDLVWGFEYRYSQSRTHGGLAFSLSPANLDTQLFGAFVQDEVALVPRQLYLTLGTKLEHNYYSGFDLMPSARLVWSPNARQTFWAAVSKADRTPAADDASMVVNAGGFIAGDGTPVAIRILGNPRFREETSIVYEAGYRARVLERLSVDFDAYYEQQNQLQTTEPLAPFFEITPAPPHLVLASTFKNSMHGESHGIDVSGSWKVTDRWTLSPGYSFERLHMHLDPKSGDTNSVAVAEGSSPAHSAQLRSSVFLGKGLSWNASAYFVGRLSDPRIPSYTRLDSGLTWKMGERFSLTLAGQNLLKDRHLEFVEPTGSVRSSQVKRSAYVKMTWQF